MGITICHYIISGSFLKIILITPWNSAFSGTGWDCSLSREAIIPSRGGYAAAVRLQRPVKRAVPTLNRGSGVIRKIFAIDALIP